MTDRHVDQLDLGAFPGHPLRFAALTDVGQLREQNEDACGVRTTAQGPLPVDAVLIAADGVGGHVGGAVASRFVVDAVRDTFADQSEIADLGLWMEKLLQSIHRELLREASGRGMSSAMGSTATIGAVDGSRLVLAHVGDSRAYRLRDGVLSQLTHDDSWVAEQARAGLLTPEEIATNPQKNVLTQCLGIGESLRVHVTEEQLRAGDRYLLCSDGLHGEVDDPGLEKVLSSLANPGDAAERLVNMANASGGPDNITAVVFDIGAVPGATGTGGSGESGTTTLGDADEAPVISAEAGVSQSRTVPALVGRPGSNWVITAGLVLVLTAGAAGSWSAMRPASAAITPTLSPTQGAEAAPAQGAEAAPTRSAVTAPAVAPPPASADPQPRSGSSTAPDTTPVTPVPSDTTLPDSLAQSGVPAGPGTPSSDSTSVDSTSAVVQPAAPDTLTSQSASPSRPDTSSGPSSQE